MKYSIVIPVYNSDSFITRTLDSLKKQKYRDFEIIIVNDGSTDNSEDVILTYAKQNSDLLIKYKKIINSGPSTARNEGLKMATGDYVCFLDSDDCYEEDLFLKLSSIDEDYDICYFGWTEINEDGKECFRYESTFKYLSFDSGEDAFKSKFNHTIWLCNCNEVYKTSMLKDNGINYLENIYSGEDSNFIYKAILASKKIIFLEGNYFVNYIRTKSLSHSSFSSKAYSEFASLIDLREYVSKHADSSFSEMVDRLFYIARVSVAKRIINSLRFYNLFRFLSKTRKEMPKFKASRRFLTKKEKIENTLYVFFRPLFFYIVKFHYWRIGK